MEEQRVLIGIDYSTASLLAIELLLEDAYDPSLYEEIAKANVNRPEVLRLILECPDTPDSVRKMVSDMMKVPDIPKEKIVKPRKPPEIREQTIFQRIQKLSVSERIQLAIRGGKEIRSILLRDSNKEVALSVLDNPRITETEIEMIAKSRSVTDEALRIITRKREWMKSYNIILALVNNPKTPVGIAMKLVPELRTRDLQILEKNRNVAEGVRSNAKKILKARKSL
ncbi:MAG: hypothetical protein HXY52_06790 [Nitrospirae bacterium]|jgi:hypothetical protein|nr:hypothetical protein [Nitrospirota bacterium]